MYFQELINVHANLNAFCHSSDLHLSTMTYRMKSKYDKNWGDFHKINRFLFIADIRDPRYKLVTQSYWFNQTLGTKMGEEFVEILRRDLELKYD